MELLIFLFSAAIISLSGVLSPGPLTAAVIQQGTRSRLTGIYISFGHGAVEIPLIVLISFGASTVLTVEWVRIVIGLAGGVYLLFMAKSLLSPAKLDATSEDAPSSFLTGILMSVANPYFILWWATIGVGLIISAIGFGPVGLVLFVIVHWLCDLVWYTLLSALSFEGVKKFGSGLYKKVSVACGLMMLVFGGVFIYNAVTLIMRS